MPLTCQRLQLKAGEREKQTDNKMDFLLVAAPSSEQQLVSLLVLTREGANLGKREFWVRFHCRGPEFEITQSITFPAHKLSQNLSIRFQFPIKESDVISTRCGPTVP